MVLKFYTYEWFINLQTFRTYLYLLPLIVTGWLSGYVCHNNIIIDKWLKWVAFMSVIYIPLFMFALSEDTRTTDMGVAITTLPGGIILIALTDNLVGQLISVNDLGYFIDTMLAALLTLLILSVATSPILFLEWIKNVFCKN